MNPELCSNEKKKKESYHLQGGLSSLFLFPVYRFWSVYEDHSFAYILWVMIAYSRDGHLADSLETWTEIRNGAEFLTLLLIAAAKTLSSSQHKCLMSNSLFFVTEWQRMVCINKHAASHTYMHHATTFSLIKVVGSSFLQPVYSYDQTCSFTVGSI